MTSTDPAAKPAPIRALMTDMHYAPASGKLCVQYGDKQVVRFKKFMVVDPKKAEQAEYAASVSFSQNKLTLVEKKTKQQTILSGQAFADMLMQLKEATQEFCNGARGRLHLHVLSEGTVATGRKGAKAPRPCGESA